MINEPAATEMLRFASASDNEWPVNCESVGQLTESCGAHDVKGTPRITQTLPEVYLDTDDRRIIRRQYRHGVTPSDLSRAFRVPVALINQIITRRKGRR